MTENFFPEIMKRPEGHSSDQHQSRQTIITVDGDSGNFIKREDICFIETQSLVNPFKSRMFINVQ